MAFQYMAKGLSVDSMNNLQMLEIWDALLNLEEASGNLFQTEIQSIKNKLEELECLTN